MADSDIENLQPRPILKAGIRDLADRLSPRLYIIVAPAGYGKTTISRLLASRHERAAYCDIYGATLVEHVAKLLLRGLAEENSARSLSLGQDVLGAGRDSERLREIAIEAWREPIHVDSLFVIDHLECADDRPDIRNFLNQVMSLKHPSRKVALCSRSAIGLRTARYAAPHETIHITPEMLRFDQNDIAEIAGQTAVTPADLAMIERRTLGWPVAVLLLLRSATLGRIVPAIRSFSASNDATLEAFLQSEVIDRLSPEQLTAIIAAAFVEDATAEDILCAFENRVSMAHVQNLLRPIPIVASNDREYVAVHPLLRAIIERCFADRKKPIALKIAGQHLQNGNPVRAAQIFLSAGEPDAAASAIESLSDEFSAAGVYLFDAPTLEAALLIARIDAATTVRHPILWASSALAWIYTRPNSDWLQEARAVWGSVKTTGSLLLRSSVLGSYANVTGILGHFDEIDSALDDFEASLSDEDSIGRIVLLMWRTALGVWHGLPTDVDGAAQQVSEILKVPATRALWNFHLAARNLRLLGAQIAEGTAIEDALHSAIESGLPLVRSLVLAEGVFHAWFWGDDAGFETWTIKLEQSMLPSIIGGFRHYIACCHGRGHLENTGYETLAFRCMGFLIGASRANSAEHELLCAHAAVSAADESNSWFYKAIARAGCALIEQSEIKTDLLREARLCARKTESPALIAAIDAVSKGSSDLGMLTEFVKRFNTRQPKADVAVSILQMNVTSGGTDTTLAPREMELLVALAAAGRMVDREELSQRMWPDKSADAARSNLRLNLLRLRNRLASSAIVSTERECGITSRVTVDMADLTAVLRRGSRADDDIVPTDRSILERTLEVDLDAIAASTRTWEWFAPTLARVEDLVREAGLRLTREAMRRESWREALTYAKRLLQRDPSDETACELTMIAAKKSHDTFAASLALRRHARSLSEEFGATPSAHLQSLLDD